MASAGSPTTFAAACVFDSLSFLEGLTFLGEGLGFLAFLEGFYFGIASSDFLVFFYSIRSIPFYFVCSILFGPFVCVFVCLCVCLGVHVFV